jgi:cellulase/cellobiase CelA1
MQAMWGSMWGAIIETFPKAPSLPKDRDAYLHFVDEIYKNDAYHSLSIEGYRVTPELIERMRSGDCRGYWEAFQTVKATVADVIAGGNSGTLVRTAHRDWCRELFRPCIAAGILPPSALAGYRNDAVYLRTSRYVAALGNRARRDAGFV